MNVSPPANRFWNNPCLIFLCLAGGFSAFLSLLIVPKFEQIFRDALGPDYPLPGITLFVLHARIPLTLVGVAWPAAGIGASWRRSRAAVWIVLLGDIFFFVLIGGTILALLGPIGGNLITVIPDVPIANPAGSH